MQKWVWLITVKKNSGSLWAEAHLTVQSKIKDYTHISNMQLPTRMATPFTSFSIVLQVSPLLLAVAYCLCVGYGVQSLIFDYTVKCASAHKDPLFFFFF